MCSSGIPVEAMAKDDASASTSSSSAVSCLRLRFTSSLFYSCVGWTWTSMAIAPRGLRTKASGNQSLLMFLHMLVMTDDSCESGTCEWMGCIRHWRVPWVDALFWCHRSQSTAPE